MATASHDSGLLPLEPSGLVPPQDHLSPADAKRNAGIWLNGDVLACACPECHAPMAIRLWLMVADCWSCGTSIELTEEQERAAQRLLAAREKREQAPPKEAAATAPPPEAPAPLGIRARPKPPRAPTPPPVPPPIDLAVPVSIAAPPKRAPVTPPEPPSLLVASMRAWSDWWQNLPAWLVSLIVHMLLMILLGLWTIRDDREQPLDLSLSFAVEEKDEPPGIEEPAPAVMEVVEPAPEEVPDPEPEPERQEPPPLPELPVQEPVPVMDELGPLPDLEEIFSAVSSPGSSARMFEGRDPRIRSAILGKEGGTPETERAVELGLRWISRHQNPDGSWSLHGFPSAGDCNGRCDGQGSTSDIAGTALALLPMLGAGYTQQYGPYKAQIREGLSWLVRKQKPNGDLTDDGVGRMYAHGQATIVLCEAYALTKESWLREPAQKALNFIVRAQHRGGGWRYSPGEAGDTSVVGWQVMALRSGMMAGLEVPSPVFQGVSRFLNTVQHEGGVSYGYTPGSSATETMTAEALLCRQYLGWSRSHRALSKAAMILPRQYPPRIDRPNVYYWYYATQVLHHYGGQPWRQWNQAMRPVLVSTQRQDGHLAGSWDPKGNHASTGGRLYQTSLSVCTLEVYYRHLPLYRSVALDAADLASEEGEGPAAMETE